MCPNIGVRAYCISCRPISLIFFDLLRIEKRKSSCLVSLIQLIEYLVIFMRIHDKSETIKNRIHLAVNTQMGQPEVKNPTEWSLAEILNLK